MPSDGCGVPFQKWILLKISMKIAPTLIMELADFFILLMWTLKGKLVRISKPKMKAEVETMGAFFGRNKEEAVEIAKKAVA